MKDDFGYPPKETSQAALRELRRIILNEIEILLTRLIFSPGFATLYRDYTGRLDYKTFEQKLLQALEEERTKKEGQKDEMSFPYIFRVMSEIISEAEANSPELSQVNSQQEPESICRQILHLLLSPDYSPPTEWKDIFSHLACLFVAWDLHSRKINLLEDFIPFGDLCLLLSFSKLMGASYELLTSYSVKGQRELMRTKKGAEAKKEKHDERKRYVIAIYEHGEAIEDKTKFNKACDIVKKQFNKCRGKKKAWGTIITDHNEMPTPSLDSIGRWLKEAGIRDRDFRQEGRYWIKQT